MNPLTRDTYPYPTCRSVLHNLTVQVPLTKSVLCKPHANTVFNFFVIQVDQMPIDLGAPYYNFFLALDATR